MDVSPMLANNNNGSRAEPRPQAQVDSSPLSQAINSANLERVRKVLEEICAENPEARAMARAKLLVPSGAAAEGNTEGLGKRKRDDTQQRYETCTQCKKEFDVTENTDTACVWHSGILKPDYDSECWADMWPENGSNNSDSHDECPEGFIWDCCKETLDVAGPECQIDVHRPKEESPRPVKMPTPRSPFRLPPNLPYIEPQWDLEPFPGQPAPGPSVQRMMEPARLPSSAMPQAVIPQGYGPGIHHAIGHDMVKTGGNAYVSPYATVNAIHAMPPHDNGHGDMINRENTYAWLLSNDHAGHTVPAPGHWR